MGEGRVYESRLTAEQRAFVVGLFEQGYGFKAVASQHGLPFQPVRSLHTRWWLVGQSVLVTKTTHRQFEPALKQEIVERFLAGEPLSELAREYDLSSTKLLGKWVAIYRAKGPEGFHNPRRGRPRQVDESEMDETQRLRRENERLRAQVAFLGKVQALRAPGHD